MFRMEINWSDNYRFDFFPRPAQRKFELSLADIEAVW